MIRFLKGRKIIVLLLLFAFFAGVFAEWAWKITGYEVKGAEVAVTETCILPVIYYDDKGRKVCVREDAVLQLRDLFQMEIPLENWSAGQVGLVEIKVSFEDGTIQRNSVRIGRKSLHKEEK